MKTNVAVVFGGKSVEHEVSIISGIQALSSIDTDLYNIVPIYLTKNNEMYMGEKISEIENYKNIETLIKNSQRIIFVNEEDKVYIEEYPSHKFKKQKKTLVDVVFPIVHGTNVEDGALQGFFKTLGVPFVGCDVTSSATCMDKYLSKMIVKEAGVPVLEGYRFTYSDYKDIESMVKKIENCFQFPVIIKPVNLGSSVGIGVANNKEELIERIDDAFGYSKQILVERAIENLREINCSVLGDQECAIASVCEEPMHTDDILSYEDKYLGNSKGGTKGMASVSRKIPAEITDNQKQFVQEMSVKAFKALNCNGVSRIDFLLDSSDNSIYFNEINTIPGSLAFYLWEETEVSYKELLTKLIDLSLKRKREEESIAFSFDTNILDQSSFSGVKGVKK
jgi:D-alanine-D-alanine ligase